MWFILAITQNIMMACIESKASSIIKREYPNLFIMCPCHNQSKVCAHRSWEMGTGQGLAPPGCEATARGGPPAEVCAGPKCCLTQRGHIRMGVGPQQRALSTLELEHIGS